MPFCPTYYRTTVPAFGLLTICLLAISLLAMTGCGGSFAPPSVNPKGATDAAMEQYDKNADDFLDQEELAACPALLDALGEYDLNADKMMSRKELGDRLEKMYGRTISLTTADCRVTLKRKPLHGAKILFVPEEFLGKGTTLAAEGITDSSGYTDMAVPAEKLPEELRRFKKLHVGVYRVEITHPTIMLPARYNTKTELGFEVHPDSHGGSHAVFDLKAK